MSFFLLAMKNEFNITMLVMKDHDHSEVNQHIIIKAKLYQKKIMRDEIEIILSCNMYC